MITVTEHINALIAAGAMSEKRFFELEIAKWKASKERQEQLTGEKYYRGEHDVLKRRRTAIGPDGKLKEIYNLPNNKLVNNQYGKMADQKNNYLLGKPFNIQTDNEQYETALGEIFSKRFHRTLKNLGEDSLNCGVGWLYIYYGENGELSFKRFAPWEILPFWKDDEHTVLDCAVRVYETEEYEGDDLKIIEKVEIYKSTGVERYILQDGVLREAGSGAYFNAVLPDGGVQPFNWEKIPVIAFKYNDEELPLICRVKSLQDALNDVMSDFQNNMQEDARNTILVIKNYDGENLNDFRYNLAQYGAVKVKTIDGRDGGVDTLQIQVNSENYKVLTELLKQAIIENARGFDAKELKSGTPNQMNIKSMYSDIDLDANGMETEWQAAFEDLLYFVNAHLANTGKGDFEDVKVEIIFNRDILMNESDVISDVKSSDGILSTETLLAKHPWVTDVKAELERIGKEKQEAIDAYADSFPKEDTQKEGAR
jgi:SPP1 family phage portal protein